MGRIISIHEYDLKPGIDLQQFEQGKHRLSYTKDSNVLRGGV
jgi:hypothetical protein